MVQALNLFYQEPDPDRWLPLDRYPRRLVRRLARGAPRPGGQMMVFINLAKGLRRLGVPYRVNDFAHARRHPSELACIVGKPHTLFDRAWRSPVLFGASVFSHPLECPGLLDQYPVRRVLVPGEWMRAMFEPYYGDRVAAWPVGIDTDEWGPSGTAKTVDVLIYDKVRWNHDAFEQGLIEPVRQTLLRHGRTFEEIRYGHYRPEQLKRALARCKAVVFLCEHETQGLAYQQMLAAGLPVLAWDRGGFWQDPSFYPHRVRFAPVSSVPYFDERCGATFASAAEFEQAFGTFWERVRGGALRPRDYVLENLTLEKCTNAYLQVVRECA